MADFYQKGESIEASKSVIYGRIIRFEASINDSVLGLSTSYKTDKNSSAVIAKALSIEEQKYLKSKSSHLSKDDKIVADSITFFVSGKRKIKITVQEGVSSTHGGQFASPDRHTFATINVPFKHIEDALRNKLLQPAKDKDI